MILLLFFAKKTLPIQILVLFIQYINNYILLVILGNMARELHSFAQFLLFVEMVNGYNGGVSHVGSILSGKELKVSIGQVGYMFKCY